MPSSLYSVLTEAVQADRCLETLRGIWENDRLFSQDAFARTAAFCAREMGRAGLLEVERLPLQADGRTLYGDWVIPQAWTARSASLTLDMPASNASVLAAYPDTPCSLAMYSAATRPGGVAARVVRCEDAAAAQAQDLQGAVLLTDQPAQALAQAALEGGAVGILSDFLPLYPGVRDSRMDVWRVHRWDNTFCVPRNETGLFAFCLTPKEGERLRALLEAGETVKVRAHVDAEQADGTVDTVSALLPGTESTREVMAYAHLYEPGAHDNASGCAALIEAARVLSACIASGALQRPRRGIRIVMGYECGGSMGYCQKHPGRIRRTDAGLVVDMVGTEGMDRTKLSVWHNPRANTAAVDTQIIALIEEIARASGKAFPYEERPFGIGTDNILSDPWFGMPTVALIAEPALGYHSSLDTPERIEPDILRRNTLLAAMYLYTAANLPQAALAPKPQRAMSLIDDGRVPVRQVMGCLNLEVGPAVERMTARERARWKPAWNRRLNTPLFWADGRRTIGEIAALSAQELSVMDAQAYAAEIAEYFTFLEKHGYIAFR